MLTANEGALARYTTAQTFARELAAKGWRVKTSWQASNGNWQLHVCIDGFATLRLYENETELYTPGAKRWVIDLSAVVGHDDVYACEEFYREEDFNAKSIRATYQRLIDEIDRRFIDKTAAAEQTWKRARENSDEWARRSRAVILRADSPTQ